MRPSMSRRFSISSMGANFGFVCGATGANTVQQSSYGSLLRSCVPIFSASSMISVLSIAISGRSTGVFVTSLMTTIESIVCEATWPSDSPLTMACALFWTSNSSMMRSMKRRVTVIDA